MARGWWIVGTASLMLTGAALLHMVRLRRNKRILAERILQVKTVIRELETQINEKKTVEAELEGMRKIQAEMSEEMARMSEQGSEDESSIRSLKAKLKEQEGHISRLKKRLDSTSLRLMNVYSDKWSTINMLSAQLKDNDKKNSTILMANISRELDKMKTNEFYRSLESELNICMDGIMTRFREQCEGMSAEEFRLTMLIFAGFSPTAISLQTDINLRTVYNKRKRLVEYIEKLNPKDKNLFLSRLVR